MSNPMKDWLADMKWEEEQATKRGHCPYCDYASSRNMIFQDVLTHDWYIEFQTGEWDEYDDDYVYLREYINYCPYCGRKLGGK